MWNENPFEIGSSEKLASAPKCIPLEDRIAEVSERLVRSKKIEAGTLQVVDYWADRGGRSVSIGSTAYTASREVRNLENDLERLIEQQEAEEAK